MSLYTDVLKISRYHYFDVFSVDSVLISQVVLQKVAAPLVRLTRNLQTLKTHDKEINLRKWQIDIDREVVKPTRQAFVTGMLTRMSLVSLGSPGEPGQDHCLQ